YRNVADIYSYIEESAHIGLKELAYTQMENGKPVDRMVMGTGLHETGEVLSRKSQMEEFMFLGLRMREGTSRSAFEQEFGISIDGVYGEILQKLRDEELLEVQAGRIKLTERGMDLGNYCMAQFLLEES
ncbi:MAG: coproporphyrinogen III oxidase, partial [Lachnospiraceae bacterium]|nr:coproporphyrinogen III oxidase [Lachnospiraceae bacterium]